MNESENRQCAELWNEYEPQFRKLCSIKLQSAPDEVEDVISEAFLALCKKVSESGMPKKPRAWLYKTVNNLINLKYRELGKKSRKTVSLTGKEYYLPFNRDYFEEIEDNILLEKLKAALNEKLSDRDKKLIKYIYEDKLKMREIAEIFQTSESAVKMAHYRLCRLIQETSDALFK